MPNAADIRNDGRGWLLPAALIALAVTAYRVAMLAANGTDLFLDEAQYWLWGQELAFGYYSKPPLIGWVIRASTEIGGSDSTFWVRLPAPLFHGATALVLGAIAAPRLGRLPAIWISSAYVTLPMVSLGSLLISTDTIMVPFLALALLAWLKGLDRGGTRLWAVLAGLALGVAFLAKYAAIYYAICAGLAAIFLWQARPGWGSALSGGAAFLLTVSPNIIWNLANGLSTLEHTLDNADWVRDPGARASLNIAGAAEFIGSQFAVFGPIFFPVLIWLAVLFRRQSGENRFLLFFSIPILAIVTFQALASEAYANWAATAYIAGTLLVVPWLLDGRRTWLKAGIGIHVFLALLLPFMTVAGTQWRAGKDGPLLLERYLGRADMSRSILEWADAQGLSTVVADDRAVLADLFYTGRDATVAIYARPEVGRAPNHYVLKHVLPPEISGPVLLVSGSGNPKLPCDADHIGDIAPPDGAYFRNSQRLFVVDASCLAIPGEG